MPADEKDPEREAPTATPLSEKLKIWLKDPRFLKVAVFVGLIAIILIFLAGLHKKPQSKSAAAAVDSTGSFTDSQTYAREVESELQQVLSQIKGVGDAEVLVTVGSSEEKIYAKDGKQSTSGNSSDIVVIDGNNGKEALTEKINSPKITGVVIVCEGGDDSRTVEKVYNAVSTALGLGASHIYVAKLK
jgi:stage III sporulation protein AG